MMAAAQMYQEKPDLEEDLAAGPFTYRHDRSRSRPYQDKRNLEETVAIRVCHLNGYWRRVSLGWAVRWCTTVPASAGFTDGNQADTELHGVCTEFH
jgi:hypothetical protein